MPGGKGGLAPVGPGGGVLPLVAAEPGEGTGEAAFGGPAPDAGIEGEELGGPGDCA